MSVYSEVKATGGYISNHESDLYIEVNEVNRAILSKYSTQKANATTFRNEVTGKMCYDMPFAYDPWWAAKSRQTTFVDNLDASLQFVSDSQDVAPIKEYVGDAASDYDSFFVQIADGDYTEVWGMSGIVPSNGKRVIRLV